MVPRMIVPNATNVTSNGIKTKAVAVVAHVVIGVTWTKPVDSANSKINPVKVLIRLEMNYTLALTSWWSSLQ